MRRGVAHLVTLAVAAAVSSVWAFDDRETAFPLSRYPMFSTRRPLVEGLFYVEAVGKDGARERLGHTWWTSGGVGTGRNMLAALRVDPHGQERLCTTIAERVAASAEPWAASVVSVELAFGQFEPQRIFRTGVVEPRSRQLVTSCPVPR